MIKTCREMTENFSALERIQWFWGFDLAANRGGGGGRRTLEEPWAAAAHSDETFAAPEPAIYVGRT